MDYPIDVKAFSKKLDFYDEIIDLHERAANYLKDFKWCKAIKSSSLYTNLGRVFCIFLFEIDNSDSVDDTMIWIIVGDIPSMYLDGYSVKTTKEVIETYIYLSEDWIKQINTSASVNDCFPFLAEPTIELADLLEKKISFMRDSLINNIEDISIV